MPIGQNGPASEAEPILGLGILLAILIFSFGDNVEIIAYLIWPSLLFLGIAFRRRFFQPSVAYLGGRR